MFSALFQGVSISSEPNFVATFTAYEIEDSSKIDDITLSHFI